jgi:hypothetical protein
MGSALLVSCHSNTDGDVASLNNSGLTANAADIDLLGVAAEMYNCLRAEGIPAEYSQGPDGRMTLITFDQTVKVAWSAPDGHLQFTEAVTAAEREDLESGEGFQITWEQNGDTFAPVDDPRTSRLIIEGVDRSEFYRSCLDSTGYSEQAVRDSVDYSRLMDAYEWLVVEASNDWAECARSQGWPTVIDARFTPNQDMDNYIPPMALLPPSITEDELILLLEVCPAFDPEVETTNAAIEQGLGSDELLEAQISGDIPEGLRAQPSIGFDYPGFNGQGDGTDQDGADTEPAEQERLWKLQAIVLSAQDVQE